MDSEWKFRIENEGDHYIIVKVRNINIPVYKTRKITPEEIYELKEYWTGIRFVHKSSISKAVKYDSANEAEEELAKISGCNH